MNWYPIKGSGGQGIVVEEGTGHTIAVAYVEKDTALLAAAPAMLKALQGVIHHNEGLKPHYKLSPALIRHVEDAIREANPC